MKVEKQTKKFELIFLSIIVIALSILALNYYKSYTFKNSDISDEYKERIVKKEQEILNNMQKNFGFSFKFPLVVTDSFQGRLYGLTAYQNNTITIYLNKKTMRESMDYIIQSVIAHEYAHALMFKLGDLKQGPNGHSKKWKDTCIKLGGIDCREYVNQQEVIMSKLPF